MLLALAVLRRAREACPLALRLAESVEFQSVLACLAR